MHNTIYRQCDNNGILFIIRLRECCFTKQYIDPSIHPRMLEFSLPMITKTCGVLSKEYCYNFMKCLKHPTDKLHWQWRLNNNQI